MMFYVASGLQNHDRASAVAEKLVSLGHDHSYDWTKHGDIRRFGEQKMKETAGNELRAVANSDFVILLLPGGNGTHTELGAAINSSQANDKKIWLWSESGEDFEHNEKTCAFYFHENIQRIVCDYDVLLDLIDSEF